MKSLFNVEQYLNALALLIARRRVHEKVRYWSYAFFSVYNSLLNRFYFRQVDITEFESIGRVLDGAFRDNIRAFDKLKNLMVFGDFFPTLWLFSCLYSLEDLKLFLLKYIFQCNNTICDLLSMYSFLHLIGIFVVGFLRGGVFSQSIKTST